MCVQTEINAMLRLPVSSSQSIHESAAGGMCDQCPGIDFWLGSLPHFSCHLHTQTLPTSLGHAGLVARLLRIW